MSQDDRKGEGWIFLYEFMEIIWLFLCKYTHLMNAILQKLRRRSQKSVIFTRKDGGGTLVAFFKPRHQPSAGLPKITLPSLE